MFNNQTIFISGGTGSFGNHFIKKIIKDYHFSMTNEEIYDNANNTLDIDLITKKLPEQYYFDLLEIQRNNKCTVCPIPSVIRGILHGQNRNTLCCQTQLQLSLIITARPPNHTPGYMEDDLHF